MMIGAVTRIVMSFQAARTLHSVVLFDTLATDFTVLGAWLVCGGHQRPLNGTAALQGAGVQIRQRIAPPDKVHVKVCTVYRCIMFSSSLLISLQISLKPRSGVLGQLVIFDFGSFYLARGLNIHVLNEAERKLVINMGRSHSQRPAKPLVL